MKARRILCALLAFVMMAALLPADLAAALPGPAAQAAEVDPQADNQISNADDWEAFATNTHNYAGQTVELTQDIELSGNIHTKDNFSGIFEGNGHTITIADGSTYVLNNGENSDTEIGLIRYLDGGTVQNLIIELEGTLWCTPNKYLVPPEGGDNLNAYQNIQNAGVLTGDIVNSGIVKNVAVLGGTVRFVGDRDAPLPTSLGGIAGILRSGTISGCFTSCVVDAWSNPSDGNRYLRAGGIAAYIGANSAIENCIHTDGRVWATAATPDWQNHKAGQAGGIVAEAEASGSPRLTNCVVYNTDIRVQDHGQSLLKAGDTWDVAKINEDWHNGTAGLACAVQSSNLVVSRCYAYGGTAISNSSVQQVAGVSTSEASAKEVLAGSYSDIWVVGADGWLGLRWMYPAAKVSLDSVSNQSDVQAAITLPEGTPGDAEWQVTVSASIRGKNATPSKPDGQVIVDSKINSAAIKEHRTDEGDPTYYSGGTYQFYVEFEGENLEESELPQVTWSVTDESNNTGEIPGATIADGLLQVKYPYYGELTIQATIDDESIEVQPKIIEVAPPELEIQPSEADGEIQVNKGSSIDFHTEWKNAFFPAEGAGDTVSVPTTVWSLDGEGYAAGTKIDSKTGMLTVAAEETKGEIVVQAALAGEAGQPVGGTEKTVTVHVTEKTVSQTVSLSVSDNEATAEPNSISLTVGQKLVLKLQAEGEPDPPAGYQKPTELKPTYQVALTSGDGSLSESNGQYTAVAAGEAVLTVSAEWKFDKSDATSSETTEPGTDPSEPGGSSSSTEESVPVTDPSSAESDTSAGSAEGTESQGANAGSSDNTDANTGSPENAAYPQAVTAPRNAVEEDQNGKITWSDEVTVTITDAQLPENVQDSAVSLAQQVNTGNGSSTVSADSESSAVYQLLFTDRNANDRFQITSDEKAPEISTPGWLEVPEEAYPIPSWTQASHPDCYLWMYRANDGNLSDSAMMGYRLQVSEDGQAIEITLLEGYQASESSEELDALTASRSWTADEIKDKGPFSVLALLKEEYGDALEHYTSLGTGEVRVTVLQVSGMVYEHGAPLVTESYKIGDVGLRPTISPRANAVLPNNSFTITNNDDAAAAVWYKIFPGQSSADGDFSSDPGSGWQQYTGSAVSLTDFASYDTITVAAVAVPAGGQVSEMDTVTFTESNLLTPDAPSLRIGDLQEAFVPGNTYADGDAFTFSFADKYYGWQTENSQVYYTLNGLDPVPGSEGTLYNADSPPRLNFGLSTQIVIKALVYDPVLQVSSAVASFTVQRSASVGRPVPSLTTGTVVIKGQALTLELPESFVEDLPDLLGLENVQYAVYGQDSSVFEPFAEYELATNSDTPVEGMRYLVVDTGSNISSTMLPEVCYLLDDTESVLKDVGRPYQYAVCQVWYDAAAGTNYVRYTSPDEIILEGEADSTITLRAQILAPDGVTAYQDGDEGTFLYTIRSTLAAPTAVPSTDTQGATTVNVGDRIALTSDPDTYIYYTTNGSQPRVSWNEEEGLWEIGSEATKQYDENQSILVTNTDSLVLIIHAVAVSVDNSLETSPLATFVYTVDPLPRAAAPTATPVTDAANPTQLARGETISLHTTTLNTNIYYTVNGSVPQPDVRDEWDAAYAGASQTGTDADTGKRYYMDGTRRVSEPDTCIYDVQQGIAMEATREQQLFVVTALVREINTETPTTAPSDAVSFVYQLAKAAAPEAAPAGEAGSAVTVEPGSLITLTTSTVGARIYYTTDTTLPVADDPDAVAQAYEEWLDDYEASDQKGIEGNGVRYYLSGSSRVYEPSTKPYIAEEGILMPEGVTTFLTLRAVAVVEDGTRADSDVSTFSYQLPAPVQAVYASPVDGTAVTYGDQVTLACGTEDAQIFYKIYTSEPAEDDVPVVNQDLLYTGPITVTREVWIRAIATRQGMRSTVTTYHYTVAPTAAAPTASLPTGSVVFRGTRIQLSGEGTIVYTTDGSDPKTSEAVQYGGSVNLDGDYGATVTVRAYIQRDGYTPSDTVSFSYTICGEDDYLIASVASGSTVASGTALTLSTGITGGRIFYTVDGSTPAVSNVFTSAAGKNYTTYEWAAGTNTTEGSSLTISGSPDGAVTIKATVVANGCDGGTVATFTYRLQSQTAAPSASIPSGAVVLEGATVELTAAEGVIYYTTDGTDPTTSSAVYSRPIDVYASSSVTIRAIAVAEGKAPSAVAVFRYTRAGQVATPTFSQTAGEIDTGTAVAITSATANASIYYSTDGTTPTQDNLSSLSLYVAPISVTRAVTIKAIAVRDGMEASEVRTATYTVRRPTVEEPETVEEAPAQTTVTDRLTSRRTYSSEAQGPFYSDIVLRESVCNTVLSAPEGAVPGNALLTVNRVEPTQADAASVGSSLGQSIALVYEAQLTVDGESVRPSDQIELGFAIPAEYQNGVVTVSRINDDGTLTQFSARRSGGIAYVETDSLGRFALSVPDTDTGGAGLQDILPWVGGGLALVLAAVLLLLVRRRRKQAAAAAAAGDDGAIDNLEDFQNFR